MDLGSRSIRSGICRWTRPDAQKIIESFNGPAGATTSCGTKKLTTMPLAKKTNQAFKQYKDGGGTKSFTEWLHTEKEKMFYSDGDDQRNVLLLNKPLNDSINTAIADTLKSGGLKTEESGKTVFGINKSIVIGAAILLAAIITYVVIKNVKTKT